MFADCTLESSELLLNTLEGTGLERTGYFVGQEDLNYWEVSHGSLVPKCFICNRLKNYDIDKQMDLYTYQVLIVVQVNMFDSN